MRLLTEIIFLCLLYKIGTVIINLLQINMPPAFAGMGILFLLLQVGWIKLEFLEKSSNFFSRHVILFLIPIVVGLINYGSMILHFGFKFIAVIAFSSILALFVTGSIMKGIQNRRKVSELK